MNHSDSSNWNVTPTVHFSSFFVTFVQIKHKEGRGGRKCQSYLTPIVCKNVLTNKNQSLLLCVFLLLSGLLTKWQTKWHKEGVLLSSRPEQRHGASLVSAEYSKPLNAKCFILYHFKPQSHLIVRNGHSNGHFIPNIVLMLIKFQLENIWMGQRCIIMSFRSRR